jgi:hypothetical protein
MIPFSIITDVKTAALEISSSPRDWSRLRSNKAIIAPVEATEANTIQDASPGSLSEK